MGTREDTIPLFPRFAVEHWFRSQATEPGYVGDIVVIQVHLHIRLGFQMTVTASVPLTSMGSLLNLE